MAVSAVRSVITADTSPGGVLGVVTGAAWFAYDVLVSKPLRAFYFEGPIWHNQPSEEICYEMTGVEARHWASTPENLARCEVEMERRFKSWDRTAMTIMHFALLAFAIVRVACCCCCYAPRPHFRCSCDGRGESHVASREELRELLREAVKQQAK